MKLWFYKAEKKCIELFDSTRVKKKTNKKNAID